MARQKTTKLQVSGEVWHVGKYNQAAIKGLPTSAEGGGSGIPMMLGGGIGVAALACGIAFVVGQLAPSPEQGRAEIMATQQGGLYVEFEDKIHPVTNVASARLITGSAEDASVIDIDAIAGETRGNLMGIPSAPNSLDTRSDETSSWGVCDWSEEGDLSLTRDVTEQTTVVAGADSWSGGTTLDDGEHAILARNSDSRNELWLLFDNHRARVGPDDYATHSALGISQEMIDNAPRLSPSLLNAIPTVPTLTTPDLEDDRQVSRAVPRHQVGDVLSVPDAEGTLSYYAVTVDGIQHVPRVVADMMVNSGGSVEQTTGQDIAAMPQSTAIELGEYPQAAPEIVSPGATCYSWSKTRDGAASSPHIVFADALPIHREAADRMVELLPGKRGSSDTASRFVSAPGSGWFVRVTGNREPHGVDGQVAFIADDGTRYDIVPDDQGNYETTLAALGLDETPPLEVPDSLARLLPSGPDLDQRAALIEHVSIPVDLDDTTSATGR